jgi:hypothetical protein
VRQNSPNPFRTTSIIEFSSPAGGLVTLKISNMLGKVVSTKMVLATRGMNRLTVNAKELGPGVYFYTVSSDKNSATRRMIVDNE